MKNLLVASRENAVPPKYIYIIYEFYLARQKHAFWVAAVPESYSTAEHAVLNSNFNSDAVLLPRFYQT